MSVLVLLMAFVLGTFAGRAGSVAEGSSPVASFPSAPPPATVPGNAPPPAWVETESGSYWLAYSGFCWGPRCVKVGGLAGPDELPPVVAQEGEVVRFHLGFRPRSVWLSVGRGDARRLEPGRTVTWRVSGAGVLSLLAYAARGAPGGSAGYVAVFRLG